MRRGIHLGWRTVPRRARRGYRDVERLDRELLDVLDEGFDAAARAAGPHLICAPGCDECCHGPFPVTPLDVRRLRRGIEELEERDAERAAAVRRRADGAREALAEGFPGDRRTGMLGTDTPVLDRFFARHEELACPALDPESGRCDLYDHRPVSCRTYGPPLRFGDRNSPPCRLCFTDAAVGEVEACRYAPDPGSVEIEILQELGVESENEWATLIAFALVDVG